MVYTATSAHPACFSSLPTCKMISNSPLISNENDALVLILVADLPHLTQLMPGGAERVLELQDFDLKDTNLVSKLSKTCRGKEER